MKKFHYLPFLMLSATALAETQTQQTAQAVIVEAVAEATAVPASEQAVNSGAENATDNILPQLSLEAQQARAAELANQAELQAQQEAQKQFEAQQLAEAKARIQQEVGSNALLLADSVAKVYLDNQFAPLWTDAQAQKLFLKEYAAFAVSGVSAKSAKALQQILNAPEGLAKDILLTDGFLDYLYYNKNVVKFANQWLYNLGSYKVLAPASEDISRWLAHTQQGSAAQYFAELAPRNHLYQETLAKLFSLSLNDQLEVASSEKNSKKKQNKTNKKAPSVSFSQLALNAQRLRLIPSFDNGIFVNIPSYQLHYMREGKLVLHSKVIVGRDSRRTPVMYSKLSNVVVNPPWNVPASIKNKDIVPKMRRDPSYAERSGYEIIDSSGNKVSPYSIDWAAYDSPSKNFPYHLRQKAGDDSALGRYKFNMPSSDAIYLHDTPNRGLFGKSERALSSGCVRVAKSDELATLLLKEAGWSDERKQRVLASKRTTSAPIHSDNPVYLYYVTAWVENGQVHRLPDIYKYDTKIPQSQLDWTQVKTQLDIL